MTVTAGELTRRFEILQPETVADALHSTRLTWRVDGGPAIWGKVEPVRGEEIEAGEVLTAVELCKVTVYYTARITARSRLRAVHDGRIYEILGLVNWQDRDRFLTLTCRALTDSEG